MTLIVVIDDDAGTRMLVSPVLKPSSPHEQAAVRRQRILMVDDNAINLEVALAILMDVNMPVLDGFAASRQILARPAHHCAHRLGA